MRHTPTGYIARKPTGTEEEKEVGLLAEEDRKYLIKEFEKHLGEKVVLHFFAGGKADSSELTEQILSELEPLHELITVQRYSLGADQAKAQEFKINKAPAIVVARPEKDYGIRFYGVPAGYEFGSLIEDIIEVSRGATDLPRDMIEELQELDQDVHIQVFVTAQCPYCPRAVRTAHKFALVSDRVVADMVMATDFQELSIKYGVSAVPHMVVNEAASFIGALPEREFLNEVLKGVHV